MPLMVASGDHFWWIYQADFFNTLAYSIDFAAGIRHNASAKEK
jgi:hypothetical protein